MATSSQLLSVASNCLSIHSHFNLTMPPIGSWRVSVTRLGRGTLSLTREAKAAWNVHQAVATYRDATASCRLNAEVEADGVGHGDEGFGVEGSGRMASPRREAGRVRSGIFGGDIVGVRV